MNFNIHTSSPKFNGMIIECFSGPSLKYAKKFAFQRYGKDKVYVTTILPTAEELGTKFAELLLNEIGAANFTEVRRRNRTETYKGHCASHDFCDANMTMHAAFMSFGIDPLENSGGSGMDSATTNRWNEAWDWAHANKLS